MRHFSKLMMMLSTGVISFTSCQDNVLDMPAETLNSNKVHARMYVSLNYDDAVFKGNNNVSNRRFIVEARDAENSGTVIERKEIVYNTNSTLTEGFERLPVVFELDQKKYVVSVWMDYIEEGTDKDFYYNTKDLSNITMVAPESEANVHHDALVSTQTIDLTEQALGKEFAVNTNLTSPVANVTLVAQDWLNFMLDKGEAAKTANVKIKYESEMPMAYNALTGSSTLSVPEETTMPLNIPENPETSGKTTLATNYFLGTAESAKIAVEILSAEGTSLYSNSYTATISSGSNNKVEESFLTGTDTPIKEIIFDGSGSEENPFQIKTIEDLYKLAELINTDNNTDYQSVHYIQTADFDLTGKDALAIGTEKFPFKGTYDGNGKTISNNTGLFGVIEGATIKNVRLENPSLDKKTIIGGLICSTSKGTSTIENCGCEFGDIEIDKVLGGICGEIASGTLTIKGVKVSGNKLKVLSKEGNSCNGGFIGKISEGSNANITDSYIYIKANIGQAMNCSGDCLGGFCGINDNGSLSIERCYIDAKLQGGKNSNTSGGIIVGKGDANITDCYTAKATNKYYTGNGVDWTKNETVDNKVSTFAADAWPNWSTDETTAWGNIGKFDAENPVYPTLKWENK